MSWTSFRDLFAGKSARKTRKTAAFRPRIENLEDRAVPATLTQAGFTETQVGAGVSGGTAMELAANGDVWVLEQGGAIKRYRSGSTTADVVANLNTGFGLNSSGERGVLGIAFDPDYATNKHVYIYYTTSSPALHNRVARFTVNDSNAADYFFVDGSDADTLPDQTVIFELDNLSSATNHNGGAIHFGPDGKLYVAVGDNANGAHAQTLSNLHGKMLRINKDGTIPTDNPFYTTATGDERAIWALGLRNPFTFTFQPGTGRMHINDVGQNTWEEINVGIAGSNYGWPTNEGAGTTPPSGPGTLREPFFSYQHTGGTTGGFAITGGAFHNPTTNRFPTQYTGDYFYADFVSDWINVIDLNTKQVTNFATSALGVVDLKVSSDGYLYYLARDAGGVFRVDFTGNPAPTITQQPTNQTAATGQAATFTVAASGTGLTYQWQRAESGTTSFVNISGATGTSYTVTNAQASDNGDRFRAVVTNANGSATSNFATLTVTANQLPTATINLTGGLRNGNFDAGTPITFTGTVTDPEDGTAPTSNWTWEVNYITSIGTGTPVVRPFIAPFSGVSGSSFTPATTGPYTLTDVAYRVTLTVTDSQGATRVVTRDVSPNTSTMTLTSNIAGLTLTRDGQPVTAPNSFSSVVGFIRPIGAAVTQVLGGVTYNFASWSDGGAATHNVATPQANTTYTANYVAATPAAPSGLSATAVSASQINLSWIDGSSNESGFALQRATDSGFTQNLVTTNLGANTTSAQATGLAANTTYYFRVRAVNGTASSAYTATASATTQPAAATSVKVNFQDTTSAGFSGYLADTGAVFANRGNGWSYGWNVNNAATSRNRNAANSPDERYDTLQHMQKPENPNGVWEIAVPNGQYTVRIVSGDPAHTDSVFRTNVEGVLAVNGTPTTSQRWFEGTVTVTVSDGRLTVSNASGAANNKINFIEISSVGTPPPSGAFQQDSGADGLVVMEAENNTANVSQGGKSWVAYTATAGFSGSGALNTTPNTGVNNDTGYTTTSPRLDFQVNFTKTGTHYVWIRGIGPTGSDDSVHVGLDGAALTSADRISSFPTGAYGWTKSTMDGVVATINVTTTGVHTVNVWMREDGTIVDKILLTTSASYTPTGAGPAESSRGGGQVAGGDGLTATYYDNRDFTGATVTRTDATVNFDWSTNAPVAGILADTFSARWTGSIRPETTGTYTFYTTSDDGVRLRINGQTIIDQWNDHAATVHSGTIALQAGQSYAIQLEYYENGGLAVMKLEWELPGLISRQVVPTSRLYRS